MSKWKRRENPRSWRAMASEDSLLTDGNPYEPHANPVAKVYVLDGQTRCQLPDEAQVALDHLRCASTVVLVAAGSGAPIALPSWVFEKLYEPVPEKVSVELEVEEWKNLRDVLQYNPRSIAGADARIAAVLDEAITKADKESL